MTQKIKFLNDLLAVCVKHKANIHINHLDFADGTVYEWVEANGQWDISQGALIADKMVTQASIERFVINSNEKPKFRKKSKKRK